MITPQNKKVFSQFLLPYLAVLCIPLLLVIFIYSMTSQIIKEQAINLHMVKQSTLVERVDSRIKQIDELIIQLYMDDDIMSLSDVHGPDFSTSEMMALLRAVKKMNILRNQALQNKECFIIYPNNDIVLATNRINSDLRFYYRNFFAYDGMTYDEWIELNSTIIQKTVLPAHDMIIDNRNENYISYITPMNSRSGVSNSIFVYFMIDTGEIYSIMNAESDVKAEIYVANALNTVLYASDDALPSGVIASLDGKGGFAEMRVMGKDSIVVYTTSEFNNWKYVSVIASDEILSEVNALVRLIALLFAAVIIITLLIAGFFTWRVERPVSSLLSMVSKTIAGNNFPNVFDTIGAGVSKLIDVNVDMEGKLAQQEKTLEALYVERLLSGRAQQTVDFLSGARNPLAAFGGMGMSMIVLLVHCGHVETALFAQALDMACGRSAALHPDVTVYTHVLAENELAIIVGANAALYEDPAGFERSVAAFAGDMINGFSDDFRKTLHVAAGGACGRIEQIGDSLEQARYTLRYMFATNEGRLLWYRDISVESQKFYYPIDIERHIINNVRAGNVNGLALIRERLYNANFVEANLSIGMKKCLLYNLYCTFIKTVDSAESSLTALNIKFLETIEKYASDYDGIFEYLFNSLGSLVAQYASSKKSHNNSLIQNIIEYIDSN
ncbi:MAG: hypothetical protein FWH01_16960, partial [Oscillospiraceae bacterium]|nr:hypothetical protein [Oscillospiraceae bacterium]